MEHNSKVYIETALSGAYLFTGEAKMDEKLFQDIGLTNAETKIYLALLKTGLTTAGPLLTETGLQNSTLHKTLHKLVKKGFASFTVKGKTRYYQASDPDILLKFIREKEAKFESMLPELKILQTPVEKQEAEIFEGFAGFKNMCYEFIRDGKKGDEYLFFSFYTKNPNDFENVYTFYREFEKERRRLGLVVKGIAPISIMHKFEGRNIKNITFVDYPVLLNMSVFNNKVLMTPWEDRQISFLIHSKQLAESFRSYFYSIYNR
jgi:HTH-type transcriptional regulator, sugar sensing transcriptional regulator